MIQIKIKDVLTPYDFEKLEDELKNFLEKKGLNATIENSVTGNTTKTRQK